MKNIFLLLLIFCTCGCKGQNLSNGQNQVSIPYNTMSTDQASTANGLSTNPGEIALKIRILEELSDEKEICGAAMKKVFKIKVIEILKKGMGISRMPRVSGEIKVKFLFLNNDMAIGSTLEAKAKESLCPDASKNYFTILSYTVLE